MRQLRIWKWDRPDLRYGNFGDEITIPLLHRIFGIEAVPSALHKAQLIAAGSILDTYFRRPRTSWKVRLRRYIREGPAASELHVWGSGFLLEDSQMRWPQRKIIVSALRGPKTARRIGLDNITIGDPGILASRLIESRLKKRSEVAIVPHYTDVEEERRKGNLPKRWILVDPCWPVLDVIAAIASSEIVVSGSLHGLITADSFGIPCVWTKTVQPLWGTTDYKFRDYEGSRGMPLNKPITYDEAKASKSLSDLATVSNRSISEWQDQMIKAFPF